MSARAEMAEEKTRRRGADIARIAAMKKVLSPISDIKITVRDIMRDWRLLVD